MLLQAALRAEREARQRLGGGADPDREASRNRQVSREIGALQKRCSALEDDVSRRLAENKALQVIWGSFHIPC